VLARHQGEKADRRMHPLGYVHLLLLSFVGRTSRGSS
jgi:hypothetical protein